jgi:hypothetical protein
MEGDEMADTNTIADPVQQIADTRLDELRQKRMQHIHQAEIYGAVIRQREQQERRDARLKERGLAIVSEE